MGATLRCVETRVRGGVAVVGRGLTRAVGAVSILSDVSVSIAPGELVAIVGGSGAGKTTLLEVLSGISAPDAGTVSYDGVDLFSNLDAFRSLLGYVPQDDIIHTDLPLERTLRYAAQLRLPATATSRDVGEAVETSLRTLDLERQRATRVVSLSGGQRKRASIAVELLTNPHVFFLDEPSSGLDPATSAELLRVLRRLADGGATVVFTTHAVQDLGACDRVVFLGRGGRLAFAGGVSEALRRFGVGTVEEIYERVDSGVPADRQESPEPPPAPSRPAREPARVRPGAIRQWSVLTRRTFETLTRNRLTLAILLGSPAFVVAMMTVLFRPGAFDFADPQPSTIVQILFWLTFDGFFFGLTYGLLQIVTEQAILRREHFVGLRLSSYLLSKITVLLPFLVAVNVVMVAVLRGFNRLPADDWGTYVSVTGTLTFLSVVALILGLLTSAAVSNASQATLALPMLCFPTVLFSGAILPVHIMAGVGAAVAAVMPARWAFEAVGHDLGIRHLMAHGGSPLGPPLLKTYGGAGLHSAGTYELYLAAFAVVFLLGAWLVLRRTASRSPR